MTQQIKEKKTDLAARKAHGDLAAAARKAGVSTSTFRKWWSQGQYLNQTATFIGALESVISEREKALAAVL